MARPLVAPDTEPKTALVAIAHADDVVFFCGGAVLMLVDAGWTVHVARVTDDRWDSLGLDEGETAARNRAEFERAMERLGVARTHELGYPTDVLGDCSLVSLRDEFVDLIREIRPYLVATFDPYSRLYEDNEDHKLVARAMAEATWTSGFDKHRGVAGASALPHLPIEKWYFGREVGEVTHELDLGGRAGRLIDAIAEHRTMLENMVAQYALQADFLGYSLDRLIALARDEPRRLAELVAARQGTERYRVVDSSTLRDLIDMFGERR